MVLQGRVLSVTTNLDTHGKVHRAVFINTPSHEMLQFKVCGPILALSQPLAEIHIILILWPSPSGTSIPVVSLLREGGVDY